MLDAETSPSSPPRRGRAAVRVVVMAVVLVAAGVSAAAWVKHRATAAPAEALPSVRIAALAHPGTAALVMAAEQGLFVHAGVQVATQPHPLGKDALKAVFDGRADLAVVADTPVIFALLGGKEVAVLTGLSRSRRALAIVARTDRGIRHVKDLAGKTVALAQGTNQAYFLDALLQVHGVAGDAVNLRDVPIEAAIAAVKAGTVDAAVLYQPHLARVQATLGEQLNVFHGDDVYSARLLLVGTPAYIDAHPHEIQRVLGALMAATDAIHADPHAAQRAIGAAFKLDLALTGRLFDPDEFVLSLDQALLLSLDDQSRWAMKRGLVPAGPVPNFLNAIKFAGLKAVRPSAVQFAH